MSSSKIPSPSRSRGVRSTPRQRRYRQSRSVSSPARSITSVKLSTKAQENNKDSFIFSPLQSRKSVLSDNTEIEIPKRGSWWKRLDENSKDVLEFIEKREQHKLTNIEELIDAEILSQEKKNYTFDLPESSDGESIRSIVLPQRKLFTQKDQSQKVYKNVIDKRENLERLQKSKVNYDNTINVGKKDLFSKGRERSKPAFPAGLLNISLDKTELNKKDKDISKQGQVRNLFGNRAGTKRKNMFAEFIVSDSEDEISDIQTKVFGFAKNPDQQQPRASPSNHFRESSPTSDITDVELDDWKQLPSSTMVDNQFGNMENNTPVKKARLSKMMPLLEETNKSKYDKVQTSNRSFKASDNTLENKPDEEKNQTIIENNIKSNNSKISQGSDEIVKVVENCGKEPEVPQSEYTPIQSSRKSKGEENINEGTKVSENISKNKKDNLQRSKEYETSKGNHKPIGDIETEESPSESNTTNVQEGEENEASEENQEESGDDDISQNISENNDFNQEDDNNDEDLQEDESSDEDQGKQQECTSDRENREEVDDIEMAQSVSKNIDMDIPENEEYKADEGNQEEINNDEIMQNNCKNNKEIRDKIGISSQLEQSNNSKNLEKIRELDKMEMDQNVFKNDTDSLKKACVNYDEIDNDKSEEKKQDNHMEVQRQEQSDERQINIIVDKEMTIEGSKLISYENKDVVDNEDQNKDGEEDPTKNNQKRTISTKDLNKSQRKDKNQSLDEKNKSVIDNRNQNRSVIKDNSQTRANVSKDLNKSQRNDKSKNKSINSQDSLRNDKTAHNKTEQSVQNRSKIDVTHDTTGRNRQKVELEVKSPEEVRNYIANNIEYISPSGRETSSRKTRSVIKLNELRPSLAPLRESTGISDGTYNSSVERSGWDSHRTTRKTLRQTFGKDFTPRKSLRALVMEKSAKRQTYGFDVTTKIPQACSTRLPENMHDITNDDTVDQQHENEMHLEASENIPVKENEEDLNVEKNKEKTFSHNASKEPKHLKVNETQLQLQENDVIQTVDPSNVLTDEKQTSHSNKKINESSKERIEYENMQQYKINGEEINKFQSMELIENGKEIQAMQDSHNEGIEINDEEMRDSQRAEIETSEQIQDSQNSQNGESDEEMQDSQSDQNGESNLEIQESQNGESDEDMQESQNDQIDESVEEMQDDVQEDMESEDDRRESQNIEEGQTDEERESSQEVEADEESDQEMRYSEDDEGQERIDSQSNEIESEREGTNDEHENEESAEGRRYSSKVTFEEESDEENVDSQNVPKQRYFINNSTQDQSSYFTEESNHEDTLTRRQNIIDILQRVKQQNQEMSRQAEQAVRNSLKRPPRESLDVFKVPLKPNTGLRRLKSAASKSKLKTVKSTHVGIENLPPEVLEDLKYKPPKRYRPSNAAWITKRLYKFLETKLESKYDYKARVRAEKLAETLYEFAKETRRRNVADSYAVDTLKNEMARLGIVSTHFEFYQFFHDFMPREIRIKVVPDIVNKISMPKHGIFSNIIR